MNYWVNGEMVRYDTTVTFGLEIKQDNQFMAAVQAVDKIKNHYTPTKIKILDVYVLGEEDD